MEGEGRRAAGGALLALGTPLLVALAFPPVGLWPLIWVAFVPMVVAQHRVMPAGRSGLAIGIGVGGMFAFHLSPGLADGDVSFVVQLWPLFVAALVAALARRSRAFQERTDYRWFLVSAPVAWVALDFLRASGTEVLAATFGATIICYDLDFTDTARKMARGGARLVATPSADVPAIAETHYTHLVFRPSRTACRW